jgi:hypothetical protein
VKKNRVLLSVIVTLVAAISISSCTYRSYDPGYDYGYRHGYRYYRHRGGLYMPIAIGITGTTTGFTASNIAGTTIMGTTAAIADPDDN